MGSLRRIRDDARVLLAAEHVIGRLATCRPPLEAAFVSSVHALIRWTGESWDVRDLGSRNGTFVDGERLQIGAAVRVKSGTQITFGERTETWEMVDDEPPVPAAFPLDGGEPSFFASGVLAVPSANEPVATIFAEGDGWRLEIDDAKTPLLPGDHFEVAGRRWRFDCPSVAPATRASGAGLAKLADVTLAFEVSTDEEHVALQIRNGPAAQHLGHRTCFYLGLVLSRERIKERQSGLPDPGWIALDSVLKMVPDYSSHSHLNVDIFRLRRVLFDTGVQDAARVVERRRGQIRFGTERVEIVRAEKVTGDVA